LLELVGALSSGALERVWPSLLARRVPPLAGRLHSIYYTRIYRGQCRASVVFKVLVVLERWQAYGGYLF
jgi:hypothetical protein